MECAVGEAPCLTPSADSGIEVDEAEVIYWGRCPDCIDVNDHPNETSRQEKDRRV